MMLHLKLNKQRGDIVKKNNFDLTGKAVDCSRLRSLGDAGKEIFRALMAVCNGVHNPEHTKIEGFSAPVFLRVCENGNFMLSGGVVVDALELSTVDPSDVLGADRIDSTSDGATLVFEGDVIPENSNVIFYSDGKKMNVFSAYEFVVEPYHNIVSYKLPKEKQLSIESRILSEKMGFKELCPISSSREWDEREAETYDELCDAHLELIRENMALVKEKEALAQRIKNLHRAINDAKACLDE